LLWGGGHFACCSDDEPDEQLEFQALQAIDNPEHHMRAIALSRLYRRANAFLHSILFRDLTLRDLLRADGRRVVYILSAIINFLHYRQDKLSFLEPIVQEYSPLQERHTELRAKIAEVSCPYLFFTIFCILSGERLKFSISHSVFLFFPCGFHPRFPPSAASERKRRPST
jgi:hypothetical protein